MQLKFWSGDLGAAAGWLLDRTSQLEVELPQIRNTVSRPGSLGINSEGGGDLHGNRTHPQVWGGRPGEGLRRHMTALIIFEKQIWGKSPVITAGLIILRADLGSVFC